MHGPGQQRRGRLVTGNEQRDQLVAQLLIRQPVALLVAGLEQQGENVLALLEVGVATGLGDQAEDLAVDRRLTALEAAQAHQTLGTEEGEEESAAHVPGPDEDLLHRNGQPAQLLALREAEDAAQDHGEGQLLHARQDGVDGTERPSLELRDSSRANDLLVGAHALAMKGR